MSSNQREVRLIVIEGGIIPTSGLVTRFALHTKRSCVFIILGMTGNAFRWRSQLNVGLVAILAGNINMLAH